MVRARRRAWRRGIAVVAMTGAMAAAACNALNGGHDRFLDGDDAGGLPTRGDGGGENGDASADVGTVVEAAAGDAEAGVLQLAVSRQFITLNGATFDTTDAGTTIITYDAGATHPVIVPLPQPSIPSEDFTVLATVFAPNDGEFGILTRVQADGQAVVFGSKYGSEEQPFLGTFGPPGWNPTDNARALAYTYRMGARYNFKVRATGNLITAKMWDAMTPEPAESAAAMLAGPFSTGRGIGFYTYLLNSAVLESMSVTVP